MVIKSKLVLKYFLASLLLASPAYAAIDQTIVRGQIDGSSYNFDKLISGDSLDIRLVIPAGEGLKLDGAIFDGEFFDGVMTLSKNTGEVLFTDTVSSSSALPFSFKIKDGVVDDRVQSEYLLNFKFNEVWGSKDQDVNISLRAFSEKNFDADSYRDAGNIMKYALSIDPNTSVDGHLCHSNGGGHHKFNKINDNLDFYSVYLKKDTKYNITVAADRDLSTELSLVDGTGTELVKSGHGKIKSTSEVTYTPSVDSIVFVKIKYLDTSLKIDGKYKLSVFDESFKISGNAIKSPPKSDGVKIISKGQSANWNLNQRYGTSLVLQGGVKGDGAISGNVVIRRGDEVVLNEKLSGMDNLKISYELMTGKKNDERGENYSFEFLLEEANSDVNVSLISSSDLHLDGGGSTDAGDSKSTAIYASSFSMRDNFIGSGRFAKHGTAMFYDDKIDYYRFNLIKGNTYEFITEKADGLDLNMEIVNSKEEIILANKYEAREDEVIFVKISIGDKSSDRSGKYSLYAKKSTTKEDIEDTDTVNSIKNEMVELNFDESISEVKDVKIGNSSYMKFELEGGMRLSIEGRVMDTEGFKGSVSLMKNNEEVALIPLSGSDLEFKAIVDGEGSYSLKFAVDSILGDKKVADFSASAVLDSYIDSGSDIDGAKTINEGIVPSSLSKKNSASDGTIFSLNNERNTYKIQAKEGEAVVLIIEPNDYLAIDASLKNSDGSVVVKGHSGESGEAVTLEYVAVKDEDFILYLDYSPLSSGYYGLYTLSYEKDLTDLYTRPSEAMRMIYDERKSVYFVDSKDKYLLINTGLGDDISVSVRSDELISEMQLIRTRDSEVVRKAYDGDDLNYFVDEEGSYLIHLIASGTGSAEVKASIVVPAEQLAEIIDLDKIDDDIEDEESEEEIEEVNSVMEDMDSENKKSRSLGAYIGIGVLFVLSSIAGFLRIRRKKDPIEEIKKSLE